MQRITPNPLTLLTHIAAIFFLCGTPALADFGDTDFDDFLAVQNFFGTEGPSIAMPGLSLAFVPDPATAFFALASLGLTLSIRKSRSHR